MISDLEYRILKALSYHKVPVSIHSLSEELGIDQSQVTAVCLAGFEEGTIELREVVTRELRLGRKGRQMMSPSPQS